MVFLDTFAFDHIDFDAEPASVGGGVEWGVGPNHYNRDRTLWLRASLLLLRNSLTEL